MPAVSVVVLVYKVEKYIEQCARALFEQTLDDLEYVFVDDCTPDASMQILERVLEDYPARRGQVKILHNEVNRGQAYSRRRGIEAASGDYIIHCDSDDWPAPDMYERMYTKAVEEKLDMVICAIRRVFLDHSEIQPCITYTDDLLESLLRQDLFHYLPNKLVARSAYNHTLIWPRNNILEDSVLIIQLAYYSRNWGIIGEALYNYRYNPESITSAKHTVEKVDLMRANADLVFSFLKKKGVRRKYREAILCFKYWFKVLSFKFPWKYYFFLYPEANLPLLFDRQLTIRQRMGHLTKLLGIHGISGIFSRK